ITLVFFSVASGKLLGQSGPWTGNYRFEVFPAPGGKFLLRFEAHDKTNEPFSERFRLVSPAGAAIGQLDVEPIPQRVRGSLDRVFVSPSGRTIYIGEVGDDGLHCRVIDSETLEQRLAWNEPLGPQNPTGIAISDDEMLGAMGRVTFAGGVD